MHTHLTAAERELDSRGASTLVNTLMNHEENIHHDISYWQRSVKGNQEYMNASEKLGALNIKSWYELESKTRSYNAPGWKISPERTALFAQFRNDPNYTIKNLVELATRSLIFEMLRADGIDAKLAVTSDSDDVFGGADVIATINTPHGEEYVAFDIAVSANAEYLDEKEKRTETICYEFNAVKNLKNKSIPRVVFAVPPRIMAKFISEYMKHVSVKGFIERKDILMLFKSAASDTVRELSEKVHSRIDAIIH